MLRKAMAAHKDGEAMFSAIYYGIVQSVGFTSNKRTGLQATGDPKDTRTRTREA
jgi:hypothetical protein